MREIAIYVEGGGQTGHQQGELRQGFDVLLGAQKEAARARGVSLKVVCAGSRNEAHGAFVNAVQQYPDRISALLVDAEDPIGPELADPDAEAAARVAHLAARDPWDLSGAVPSRIHLMAPCMEAWIAADPERVEAFYGQGFKASALPSRANLEEEPKASLYRALAKASKQTTKGEYGKIRHAKDLLKRIRPEKVAGRCPRFRTFTAWLDATILML